MAQGTYGEGAVMFGLFNGLAKRAAEKSVDDFLASDDFKKAIRDRTAEIVREELKKYPHFTFIKHTQRKLQSADPKMTDEKGFKLAKQVLQTHLRDEGIEYGDPRFGWAKADAYELAQAYEIDHWEPVK